MNYDPGCDKQSADSPIRKLERYIEENSEFLETIAAANTPLTRERLEQIGQTDPTVLERMDGAIEAEMLWVDETTKIIDEDPRITNLIGVSGVDADKQFVAPIFRDFQNDHNTSAYNNFQAIIRCAPIVPSNPPTFADFMSYGTMPSLHRAHIVAPELMESLQKSMEDLGMSDWNQTMIEGAISEAEDDHEAQTLLRASRLSFILLANLMRNDDDDIQRKSLGVTPEGEVITSAAKKLWT